jgi:hypothetical protein
MESPGSWWTLIPQAMKYIIQFRVELQISSRCLCSGKGQPTPFGSVGCLLSEEFSTSLSRGERRPEKSLV